MSNATRSLLIIVVSAFGIFLVFDSLFGKVVRPIPREYETVDGIRDYRDSDPQVLILGSSYVRSFLPLSKWYRSQNQAVDIAVVPIEGGKFFALDWLLRNRLGPLIDEVKSNGEFVRPRLSQFVLQTNYYDICGSGTEYGNLPARAWALSDYLRDFAVHGATPYNDNYVDQRWAGWTRWSTLMSDRGFSHIIPALRQKVGLGADDAAQRRADIQLDNWFQMIEENDIAAPECQSSEQMLAFRRILDFAQARELRVSIIIWPVIPKAINAKTLAVTERFKLYILEKASARNIPVFDLQAEAVVANEDFRPDLDHLLPSGEQKVLHWALEGPYRDLAALTAGAPKRVPVHAR